MHTGLLTLVTVAATGGIFLEPLIEKAGFSIPKETLAMISGLVVAAAGLVVGWFATAPAFKKRIWMFFKDNYPVAGGYNRVLVQPILVLAKGFNALENSLLQAVFGIGIAFLAIARWLAEVIDRATAYVIDWIGIFNLNIARMSSFTDDKGIVEGIAGLVDSVQHLGHYGRKIQSGLVHRELAWSVYGMVFAFIIILFTYYYYFFTRSGGIGRNGTTS